VRAPIAGSARSVMVDVRGPGVPRGVGPTASLQRSLRLDDLDISDRTSCGPKRGEAPGQSRPDHDERMKSRREVDDTLSISDPDRNGAHVRSGEARPSDDVDLDAVVVNTGALGLPDAQNPIVDRRAPASTRPTIAMHPAIADRAPATITIDLLEVDVRGPLPSRTDLQDHCRSPASPDVDGQDTTESTLDCSRC